MYGLAYFLDGIKAKFRYLTQGSMPLDLRGARQEHKLNEMYGSMDERDDQDKKTPPPPPPPFDEPSSSPSPSPSNAEQASADPQQESSSSTAATNIIQEPAMVDVLLGRGSANSWRTGNAELHRIVDEYMEEYHHTNSRREKGEIIHRVYDRVRTAGGRFLRRAPGTSHFYQVGEAQVKEKIGHTFRDRRKSVTRRSSSSSVASAARQQRTLHQVSSGNEADRSSNSTNAPDSFVQGHSSSETETADYVASQEQEESSIQVDDSMQPPPPPSARTSSANPAPSQAERSSSPSSEQSLFSNDLLNSVLGPPSEFT